jgi:hypothetical protein
VASNTTLATLRTKAKRKADLEFGSSVFISDSEWNDYLNASNQALYDLIVDTDATAEYFTSPTPYAFSVVSGTAAYSLPTDFYRLRGVDLQLNASQNNWTTIGAYNFNERNKYAWVPTTWNLFGLTNVRYRLVGNKIMFIPVPNLPSVNAQIWYVPVTTTLVNDGDTLDTINGWDEYIAIDAAIKAMSKRQLDTSQLVAQKVEQLDRIRRMCSKRDLGGAKRVTDVYANGSLFGPEDGWA